MRDLGMRLAVAAGLMLCAPIALAANCSVNAGEVVINEFLPAPSNGVEWVELFNTTAAALDIGGCYIDDLAGTGGAPTLIAAGTSIAAGGYHVIEKSSYFNNGGDDVRLLAADQSTLLDAFSYGSTGTDLAWYRLPDGGDWAGQPRANASKGASNGVPAACGSGSWTPGQLEIHHINIGQGDATFIVSPTGRTLLADSGESYYNSHIDADTVGAYIQSVVGCKAIDYVVISHFQSDHIGYVGYGGLWHLVEVQDFVVGKMLHRDYRRYLGTTSGTIDNWKLYLDSAEGQAKLHPEVAIEGSSQVDLGEGVTFTIVALDGNGSLLEGDFSQASTAPSENDYSVAAVLRFGELDYWVGGDLSGEYHDSGYAYAYHDIELTVSDEIGDLDIYRVNHHGADHSTNPAFVAQTDPEVCVISVGDANTYAHPRQSVVDLLLPTCDLYLTEAGDPNTDLGSAYVEGNIVVKTTDGIHYSVNGRPYLASDPLPYDADADGYLQAADPDDADARTIPEPFGGCNTVLQYCQIAPTLLSATLASRTLTLSWDSSGHAESYRIYAGPSASGPFTILASDLPDDAASWTGTPPPRSKTYFFYMVAVVDGRESQPSNLLSVVTGQGR